MGDRTLLVISARLDGTVQQAVERGAWPRKDFLELRRAMDADVVDYGTVDQALAWRLLRRVAGMPVAQAWIAFRRRGLYDRVFTDGEHTGIPLALLLRWARRRPRHVTIGHLLTARLKRWLFRWLRPHHGMDVVLVHATRQQQAARDQLGLLGTQLALIPYQVDTTFWAPRPVPADEMICAAGLEYRDYDTLIEAAAGLPVRVVIAAGSRWSRHRDTTNDAVLPHNVKVVSLDYDALRDLYARSRFVVVPLRQIDNQAGVTTVLEAMAMAKAVIVSATSGQCDVVRGPLWTAAGPSRELSGGPGGFGVAGPLAEAPTGLYVPPGDATALRNAIAYLLDHPDEAVLMGATGRQLVEAHMNVDHYAARIATLLGGPRADAFQWQLDGEEHRLSEFAPMNAAAGQT